jgi:hypothetical protein
MPPSTARFVRSWLALPLQPSLIRPQDRNINGGSPQVLLGSGGGQASTSVHTTGRARPCPGMCSSWAFTAGVQRGHTWHSQRAQHFRMPLSRNKFHDDVKKPWALACNELHEWTKACEQTGECRRAAKAATGSVTATEMVYVDLTVYPLQLHAGQPASTRWQGTPMPWDVFELGLHCWRAAWPHLQALPKGTPADARPGGIWAWPGRGSSRAGAGQKAHVHQRYTKHTLQTKVMRPLKKSM